MPLSELAVRNAKPRDKAYKIADSGGLHLLVQPNGGKLWRLKDRFAGKEKLLSFGPYPATSLAEARRARDEAKKMLAGGTDPSAQKRHDRIAAVTAKRDTFKAVAEEFLISSGVPHISLSPGGGSAGAVTNRRGPVAQPSSDLPLFMADFIA